TADHTNPGTKKPTVKNTASKLVKVMNSPGKSLRAAGFLHNLDVILAQAIQLVHQPVDLAVRGRDLGVEHRLVMQHFGGGEKNASTHLALPLPLSCWRSLGLSIAAAFWLLQP